MADGEEGASILSTKDLVKYYQVDTGFLSRFSDEARLARAVDGVSIDIRQGEILALVGESGCGKTTLGKLLVRMLDPTSGQIIYAGQDISKFSRSEMNTLRPEVQIIYQDPFNSMDPRDTVYEIVSEPLKVNKTCKGSEEEFKRVVDSLEEVDLRPAVDYLSRFPHELSGGQRQRVAIARVFALRPKVIIADEPVSMLDVSIRAGIIKIFLRMRDELGASIVFITHDLALAKHVADRVAVMYLGKIVELGLPEEVVHRPLHPYTKALVAAIPKLDPADEIKLLATGEAPSAVNVPAACRFHPRCPLATSVCSNVDPPLEEHGDQHLSACHHFDLVSSLDSR